MDWAGLTAIIMVFATALAAHLKNKDQDSRVRYLESHIQEIMRRHAECEESLMRVWQAVNDKEPKKS